MKTTRILSLLFSLCQFLLFLKFVELVQGDIILHSEGSINGSNNSNREQRHFFVAPRVKERKFKPWLSSTSTEKSNNNTQEDSYVDSDGTITFNKTQSDRIDLLADDNLNNSTSSSESSSGRLCPVRFFFWKFCPLDIPFVRLLFPKEMIDAHRKYDTPDS